MDLSVVMVTYRRLENLEIILKAWLEQVREVILADCSGGKFKTDLPIIHVRFNRDLGNRTRHALALLAKGEHVIKADDDILPKPGLAWDLIRGWHEVGGGIVGLLGRVFKEDNYYSGGTSCFRANKITNPTKVDFVGVTTLSPRKWLPFDLHGCDNAIEDLFWQMKAYPGAKKWVIPTKRYQMLPSATNGLNLNRSAAARLKRELFYSEYYNAYYRKELRA